MLRCSPARLRQLFSTGGSPLDKLSLAELQAQFKPLPTINNDLRFLKFLSLWKQFRRIKTPFFTVHQSLPDIEERRLAAIEEVYGTLTEGQRRYLQYQVVLRNGLLLRNFVTEKTEHLDPLGAIVVELSHVEKPSKELLESLMLVNKEQLQAAAAAAAVDAIAAKKPK